MMKNTISKQLMRSVVWVLLLFLTTPLSAQQIEVVSLEPALRDNTAWNTHTSRKLDDGRYCPIVKVRFNQSDCVFEGNLIGDPIFLTNEYRVYMNPGSYHLIIKHSEHEVLDVVFRDYMSEGKLKERCTYILTLRSKDLGRRERLNKGFHVYVGGSYEVLGFSGPSVHLGLSYGPVYAEGCFGIGTNKQDDVAIFRTMDGVSTVHEAYNYKAKSRISARLGCIVDLEYLLLTPFVGFSAAQIEGESVLNGAKTTDFQTLKPASVLGGVRISFPIGRLLLVNITPQYAYGLDNDDYFKVVSAGATDMEGWAKGFQLSAGIQFRF